MSFPTTNVWDPADRAPEVLEALAAGRAWTERADGAREYLETDRIDEAVGRLVDDDVLAVELLFRGSAVARAAIAAAADAWLAAYARERAH